LGSAMPSVPKGGAPVLLNFGVPSIYVNTLRHRTIEFGMVTHEEGRVLGGKPCHCILHKSVMQFVSDTCYINNGNCL